MTNLSGTHLNNGAAVGPQGEGRESPSTFPKYPAYKDSGVEWLGAVPEGWELIPFKYVAEFVNGMAFKPEQWSEVGIPIIRIENLNNGESFNYFEGTVEERYHVKTGDLLFGWSGNRGTSFGPFLWHGVGLHYLNQHIFRIADFRCDKKWLFWALKAVTKTIEDQAHGIIGMVHVTKGKLGGIKIPLLPHPEQTQIARFLDHETARIDALIAEQQRLIELLKEKRQAVISHAVTKGLDPTVPMKDSGVEWLGEVPAHWDILSFNLLVYIAEGQVNPKLKPYSEMLLIAPNHVESATGRLLYLETAEGQGADSGKYLCKEGDVVYSKIRPALRKVCVAPAACLCSADMYPMRGHSGLENQYLLWFILSEPFSAFALLESDRVAMPKINRESLGGLKLARPPVEEQKKISERLYKDAQHIDALIDGALSGVELLNERRSALISAAVTGKIDVRGWQPPAPTPAALPRGASAETGLIGEVVVPA